MNDSQHTHLYNLVRLNNNQIQSYEHQINPYDFSIRFIALHY